MHNTICRLPPAPSPVPVQEIPKDSVYAPFAPFIGGIWWDELPPAGFTSIPRHSETTYSWCRDYSGIYATSVTVVGTARTLPTTGLTVWNPTKKAFVGIATNKDLMSESIGTVEDGALISDITINKTDGTVMKALGRIKFTGADTATLQLFRLHDKEPIPHDRADWSKAVLLKLVRHPSP
jgi:hypothetical protein